MAQGAPEGYTSHCAARDHLDQFWAAICTLPEYAALVFHIERSRYKESDAHSKNQAVNGIWSKDGTRMIRAGSGLSLATWKRCNIALEKLGFLQRTRHENRHGKDEATEYKVLWPAITTAIQSAVEKRQLEQVGGSERATLGAQSEPLRGSQRTPHGAQAEPLDMDRMPGAQKEPHVSQSQSLDLKVSHSPRARELRAVIAEATGEAVRSDGLLLKIMESEKQAGLPTVVMDRFIHEFSFERRAAGKRTTAGLVAKASSEDFVPWVRRFENRNFIERAIERALQEREQAEFQKKGVGHEDNIGLEEEKQA